MAEHTNVSDSGDALTDDQSRSQRPQAEVWAPSKQVKLIMVGQLIVVFAVSLDLTILTSTLPTLAKALDATAVEAFWIAASYLLANAVVQPLMAALADILEEVRRSSLRFSSSRLGRSCAALQRMLAQCSPAE